MYRFFNSEQYLDKCLDSLKKQTYQNIEVILVDNGSIDGSLDICARYVNADKRFRVLKCAQRGAAFARNQGLKEAKGYYIMYVDSDDYVDKDYCKYMVECIESNDATFAVCGIVLITENGYILRKRNCCNQNSIEIGKSEKIIQELQKTELLNSIFNKIFIKKFINKYFDGSFKIGEDLLFNLNYLDNKNTKICCLNKTLYYYRIYSHLSETKLVYYSEGRLESNLKLYSEMISFANKYGYSKKFSKEVTNMYAANIIFCIKEWGEMGYRKIDMLSAIRKVISNENVKEIIEHAQLRTKWKNSILFLLRNRRVWTLYFILRMYGILASIRKHKK